MKTFIRTLMLAIGVLALAACSSGRSAALAGGTNPYAPQAGDSSMLRGEIRVVSAGVRLAESNPSQLMLDFDYFQPTPCFQLRVEPGQPDAQNQIKVSAYAVTEKDKACTLMALATPLHASMNLGSLPKGTYSVWLNGKEIGTVSP